MWAKVRGEEGLMQRSVLSPPRDWEGEDRGSRRPPPLRLADSDGASHHQRRRSSDHTSRPYHTDPAHCEQPSSATVSWRR
jgi:hypothetical protein